MEEENKDFELLTDDEISLLDVEELESYDDITPFVQITERFMGNPKRSSVPMFLRLTRRGVVFLSMMLFAYIALFVTGNRQNFLDENLRTILFFATTTAIMLAVFSFAAILESLICIFITRKIRYFFYAIAFVLPSVFACSTGIIFRVLIMLVDGFPQ